MLDRVELEGIQDAAPEGAELFAFPNHPVPGENENSGATVAEQGTLIQDETRLTRLEVLERYFTPKTEKPTGRLVAERLERFPGIGTYAVIRPRSSFILPQIREVYDANHIEGTGRNMRDTEFGQLQNCGIAFNDEEHIDQFLSDANEYFETEITKDQIEEHEKFSYYATTIFGHNRQLGTAFANQETNGHPDRGMGFFAKVFVNPPFWLVIEMQAAENTGKPPDMVSRARSIVKYKQFRTRDGLPPSNREIGEKFNVDSDQVWRAERFEALPPELKTFAATKELPYSGVLEFDRLFKYYSAQDIVGLATRLAKDQASSGQIITEIQKREAIAELSPEVFLLVDQGSLSLNQAQELAKMNNAGVKHDVINDIAFWITSKNPPLAEVRARCKERIQQRLRGEASFFEAEFGDDLSDEQRAMLEKMEHEERKAQIQSSFHEVTKRLGGIATAVESGFVGSAIADRPISQVVRDMLPAIESLLGIREVPTNEAESLMAQIMTSLEGDNLKDDEATRVLTQIYELLELEASSSPEDQVIRKEQLLANIKARVIEPEAVQESLL